MEHLSPGELVATVAGRVTDANAQRHLSECRSCSAEVEELRVTLRLLHVGARGTELPVTACLDDHEVAALAEGRIAAGARERCVEHIANCGGCRATVSSVRQVLSSDELAAEVAWLLRVRPLRSRIRRFVLPIGVAACVSALLMFERPDGTDAHRERPVTTASAPQAIAPVGSVEDARALRWRSVEGADRYRVTLFDTNGVVLHEEVLTDTVARLPAALGVDGGARYFWIVHARTGLDRWVASDLSEFVLMSGVRR